MTGTTIAQAIPIAISPILTRIYTPDDFGMFALYISIASIIAAIATGRYELAIMLPRKDENAANLVVLSIGIALIVSLVSFIIVFLFNERITNFLGNREISNWLYFIPMTVLFTGIYQSFNYWSNRKKRFRRLAINRITRSSVTSTVNIGMGFGGLGGGLILGNVLGLGIATGTLGRKVWHEIAKFTGQINKIKMLVLMRKYRKMPMLNVPNALVDSFRLFGINILIAKMFSSTILGQFSLGWKMVQSPMLIIGGSLSQVFFERISKVKKSDLNAIAKLFLLKASLVGFPIFTIIFIFAPDIFSFVFGQNWILAGQVASIISPWLFLNFLTSPLSTIFIVLNKQESLFYLSVVYMLVPLIEIFYFRNLEFLDVLIIISSSMALVLLGVIVFLFQIMKKVKNEF